MFIDVFKKKGVKVEVLTDGEYYFFFTIGWFVAKAQRYTSEPNGKGGTAYFWLLERSEQISKETVEKYIRKAEQGTDYYPVEHHFRWKNEDKRPQHELPFNINITLERRK